MGNGSGLSRGDRRRNERLGELRRIVAPDRAVIGIDLADEVQSLVVTDHDSRVLARRRLRVRAWELGAGLEWALDVIEVGAQVADRGRPIG
jgi:transposase